MCGGVMWNTYPNVDVISDFGYQLVREIRFCVKRDVNGPWGTVLIRTSRHRSEQGKFIDFLH